MTGSVWEALLLVAIGGAFLVHCSMATRREFKAGRARSLYDKAYSREQQPIGFWLTLALNMFAAAMGLAFLVIGATMLASR